MINSERFKIFDLSTLDNATSYDLLTKSLDEFLSENFESRKQKNDSYYKFPIQKKISNLSKSKQKNLNFLKYKGIFNKIKKQKYNLNNRANNLQLDMLSFSNESNQDRRKDFHIFNKNKRKTAINLIKKSNYNNLELLSSDRLSDLTLRSPKNKTYNKLTFIERKNINSITRIKSSNTLRNKISNFNKDKNNNFSFNNFIRLKLRNKNRKNSEQQSQSSTQIKTLLKNASFKSDNDNNIDSNQVNNVNKDKIRKMKSDFYLRLNEDDDESSKENFLIPEDDLYIQSPKNLDYNELKTVRQDIKLKNLLFEIQRGEKKNIFRPNEYDVKSRVNLLTKFNRDQFLKTIKSAYNNNLFFYNYPSSKNKFRKINKKNIVPHQDKCNSKTVKLLKKLQKLQDNAKNRKREIKLNKRHNLELDKLKNVLNKIKAQNNFDIKVDEKFKNDTLRYQEKIGTFFIYQGNGIYSEHLNILFKGEKIAHNVVKLDNL